VTGAAPRLAAALADRYRIERELGAGGMATVYLAADLKHDRKVAIKVLKPELAAVLGAERFVQEIKTTAALSHPHILPLFDSGEAGGFLYYVMPYIQGETIRDRLNRDTQLGIDEAVKITTEVADALDYAHRHGVIHRDIKPENILLHDGRPMVMDFGIALAVSAAAGGRMTETGLSLGTPHYMSPEQATADKTITARSDVYSLASVLYEMLAGNPPHVGSSAQQIIMKIIAERAQSVTELRASVPANVAAALAKALEKLPADRFSTASEFAMALGEAGFRSAQVRHGTDAASLASPGPWNRLTVATTALAAAFALALGWTLLRPAAPAPATRQVLSAEGWGGLVQEFGRYAALAPDGSSMIVPVTTGRQQVLGLKLRGSTEVTPIADTEYARDVVYSPDGQWIAYAVGSDLFKRPLVGGSALRLAEDTDGVGRVGLAWLDDGTILYERQRDGGSRDLARISEPGGEPLGVVELPFSTWVYGLPGSSGALVVTSASGASFSLHAVDLEDLSSKVILEDVYRAWYAPTGHLVYVRIDGAVFAQPFDLRSLTLRGGAVPLFDGVRIGNVMADMHLAADGTLLYVEGKAVGQAASQLTVMDRAGHAEALALAPRQIDSRSLAWSPDGASIAFASDGQIFTYNTVLNTTPRQVTYDGSNNSPVYSPDGTRIAFSRAFTGTDGVDLFVKNLEDDRPSQSVITLDANQFMMGWPADTLIVFERAQSGRGDLWMVDISDPENPGARPYLTSEADLRRITVSPDGALAAYRSNESGGDALYVRSFPTPGERTIVYSGPVTGVSWSPDGRTLYAVTGAGAPVVAIRLRRGPIPVVLGMDTLFTAPEALQSGAVLDPAGDRFLMAVAAGAAEAAAGTPAPPRLILVQNFFEELRQRTGRNR